MRPDKKRDPVDPENRNRWYAAGIALIVAGMVFMMFVFSLLSRTDKTDIYLADSIYERFGWDYELLVNGETQAYEPVFADDGYTLMLPEGRRLCALRGQ